MGYFMGPGDGPSMDRVYITRNTSATVRQYRHVVTPLVCLEMNAALMHCSGLANVMLSERAEIEKLDGDQARLPRFERAEFTVADRDLNEVPPYQNVAFMSHVRELATFMCEPHNRLMREPPQSWLRDVTGLRGSIQRLASSIISLVELSLPGTAHVRTGLRVQFARLHQVLLCSSPEMHIVTRLK